MASTTQPTTFQFTADNVGNPDPCQVPIACGSVEFQQDPTAVTLFDFIVHAPLMGTPGKGYAKGDKVVLNAQLWQQFAELTTVCYVEVVGGTAAFQAVCKP